MRNAIKILRQIGVYDLGVAGPERIGNVTHSIVGRFLRPESVRMLAEIGFKDRFDDEFHRHLRDPVAQRRYPERALTAVRFGDHDAPDRLCSVGLVFQITGQVLQERFYPNSGFYGLEADPINARTASVGPDKPPGMTEDVFPADLVVERVKAVGWFLLGLGIELPL